MKPVVLMSYPIKNGSATNGIVLIRSLGLAARSLLVETDRVCRGIELDPKFVDVIVKRYIEHESGSTKDVYVVRNGQKLKYEEVAVDAADGKA